MATISHLPPELLGPILLQAGMPDAAGSPCTICGCSACDGTCLSDDECDAGEGSSGNKQGASSQGGTSMLAGVSPVSHSPGYLPAIRSVCQSWRSVIDGELESLQVTQWPPPAGLDLASNFSRLHTVDVCLSQHTLRGRAGTAAPAASPTSQVTQSGSADVCTSAAASPDSPVRMLCTLSCKRKASDMASPELGSSSSSSSAWSTASPAQSCILQTSSSCEPATSSSGTPASTSCSTSSAERASTASAGPGSLLASLSHLAHLRSLRISQPSPGPSTSQGSGRRDASYRSFTSQLLRGLHRLHQLSELSLSGTGIMHLPAAVFSSLAQLTKLTVSHTAVRTLPPTLARMPKLAHLTVTHSRGITLLPELAIKGLTALRSLELQHCRIQRLPVNALNSLSNLTSLSAAGNRLSSLPPNFGSALSSLLSLDLRFNNLASLPPTFNELSQLTSLRLAGNWKLGAGSVPSEQADPISAYLPAHMPSLAVLDLSGCNLKSLSFKSRSIVSASSSIQASFATALVGEQPAQVIGPALRELHLGSNELASVPACVRELRHLQLLSLDDCGLQSLPSWLREACPDLTHLNVSGSSISRLEAAALPSKLASLVMSSSNISSVPEDIVTLADSLTELDLADNNLGPHFPEALLRLPGLHSLSLNSTGLAVLPDAVSQLTKLTWLDLSDNLVGLEALPVAALLQLRQLCVLKVGGAPPFSSRDATPQAPAAASVTASSCSTQQQGVSSAQGRSASTQLSRQQVAAELKSKLTRLRCCQLRL